MILAVPCNKSVPSNLSVKPVLNNRQIKNRRDIYCVTKLNFKFVSWLQFFGHIDSRKNEINVKSIPEISRQTSGA